MNRVPRWDICIALVSHDPISSLSIRRLLEPLTSQLFVAGSDQELLLHLDNWQPDIILLHEATHASNAYTCCRRLRTILRWKHIPVVLIANECMDEIVQEGISAGVTSFLFFPIRPPELMACLHTMLHATHRRHMTQSISNSHDNALVNAFIYGARDMLSVAMLKSHSAMKDKKHAHVADSGIAVVSQQLSRLNEILNAFWIIRELEKGNLVLSDALMKPDQIARNVAASYNDDAKTHSAKVILDIPEALPNIRGDANIFELVLQLVLSNVSQHAPQHDLILIEIAPSVASGNAPDAAGVVINISTRPHGKADAASKQIGAAPKSLPPSEEQSEIETLYGYETAFIDRVAELIGWQIDLQRITAKDTAIRMEISNDPHKNIANAHGSWNLHKNSSAA